MKIVLFGNLSHPYTRLILRYCCLNNVRITALIQRLKVDYPAKLIVNKHSDSFGKLSSWNNLLIGLYNPLFSVEFVLRSIFSKRKKIACNPELLTIQRDLLVKNVYDFNSRKCERILKEINPDIIILGPAMQIIRRNIIDIPKIGVLNAHQGLLPENRGAGGVECAILNGLKPGITIHFVDSGVDTGDIVIKENLYVLPGTTLENLQKQAIYASVLLLMKALRLIETEKYPRIKQGTGKQYYVMHPRLVDIVKKRMAEIYK